MNTMTRMQIETKAVATIKKFLGYPTGKRARALNPHRAKFEQAMTALGMDDRAIYLAWHDCRQMAELEVHAGA